MLEDRCFPEIENATAGMIASGFDSLSVKRLESVLARLFPNDMGVAAMADVLAGKGASNLRKSFAAEALGNDSVFADSIGRVARRMRRRQSGSDRGKWSTAIAGETLDFLADSCFPCNWTALQAANLALLRQIRPTKTVAVVATVRDEGLYLVEWLAFYRAIGVREFFVYSNDNADRSDELLRALARGGFIRLLRNRVRQGTNPQRKAYQHALHLLHDLRAYKWILFVDADEFLVLDKQYDHRIDRFIRDLERQCSGNVPGAVLFPWGWRLSDAGFKRTDGLLFERYPHSIPHAMVKSLVRLHAAMGMCEVHIPTLPGHEVLLDSSLSPVDAETIWKGKPKSCAGGELAHFWGKSFEEYAVKKRKGDLLSLDQRQFVREFVQFFEWNGRPTTENLRQAPELLLKRTRRAMDELLAVPGIRAAAKRTEAGYERLVGCIEREIDLRAAYEDLRSRYRR